VYRLLRSETARARQIDAFEAIHQQLALDADTRAAQAIVDLIEQRR